MTLYEKIEALKLADDRTGLKQNALIDKVSAIILAHENSDTAIGSIKRLTVKGGRIAFYKPVECKYSNSQLFDMEKELKEHKNAHKIPGYIGGVLDAEDLKAIYEKLAAYEDTGFEPRDVNCL